MLLEQLLRITSDQINKFIPISESFWGFFWQLEKRVYICMYNTKTYNMERTKDVKRDLEEIQGLDYLEQYYHELLDDATPKEVKQDIINKTLGI